ncbi:MAG: leucyl aminopeptidase [Chloroflexi bacterium]|nr:leucyl aminopeptidase [Chloroflexota bacterium]MBV9601398.1 leucyl aminopeptidase [Chloroflexota bacterium]
MSITSSSVTDGRAVGGDSQIAYFDVNLTPSLDRSAEVSISVTPTLPASSTALVVPVLAEGNPPAELGLDRAALGAAGFEGKPGQTLVLPRASGPTLVAIGIGDAARVDTALLRDAAATFTRASATHAHLAISLVNTGPVQPEDAARAVVEGVLLARYRYDPFHTQPTTVRLAELTLLAGDDRAEAVRRGAQAGRLAAEACMLTRDVGNAPPSYLTAERMAEVAQQVAASRGLGVEVFDRQALLELGCGGLLGVNAGSAHEPRMVKLTYRPKGTSRGHLALVGKGIMYDSGGINIKPGDAMHLLMKHDMAGAGAILGAMSVLAALDCPTTVTGYLMCTDNMPSGSAMKMGDVLRMHGGKTVEVQNTDAEGRLVMADALVLATENDHPDAIVDIATLTGAALRALGPRMAALLGNNQPLVDQVIAAANRTDERVWQLPLERRYRRQLNSEIADLKNMGDDANAGAITAALFLEEFVDGRPWAHLDIAGTMSVGADDGWRSWGATGFGARLLLDLAMTFKTLT